LAGAALVSASVPNNITHTNDSADTYIVVFNDNQGSMGVLDDQVTTFAADNNAEVLEKYDSINGVALKLPGGNPDRLKELKNVKYVEKDIPFKTCLDEATGIMGTPQVWDMGYTGQGVKVAVIDTGIDGTHPDLKGKVVGWKDLINNKATPYDDYGHGTHCAGIIGGSGAASDGMYKGVAPGVQFIGIKVLSKDGSGSLSTIMKGIDYASKTDANIISMSLGSSDHSQAMDDLVTRVVNSGKIVVCAAGNSGPGTKTIGCPADTPAVITVGATDKSDNMASFSSRGPTKDGRTKPDICAPGKDIISCRATGIGERKAIDKYYISMSGTSMACPMVAGSIALMVQKDPSLTPQKAKELLENTAKHGNKYPNYNSGYGRVNIKSAIDTQGGKTITAPVKSPAATPKPATPKPPKQGVRYPEYPSYPYPGYQYPGYQQYPAYSEN
jgi:serine protease AprX